MRGAGDVAALAEMRRETPTATPDGRCRRRCGRTPRRTRWCLDPSAPARRLPHAEGEGTPLPCGPVLPPASTEVNQCPPFSPVYHRRIATCPRRHPINVHDQHPRSTPTIDADSESRPTPTSAGCRLRRHPLDELGSIDGQARRVGPRGKTAAAHAAIRPESIAGCAVYSVPWIRTPLRVRRWLNPTSLRPSSNTSPGPSPAKQTRSDHGVVTIDPRVHGQLAVARRTAQRPPPHLPGPDHEATHVVRARAPGGTTMSIHTNWSGDHQHCPATGSALDDADAHSARIRRRRRCPRLWRDPSTTAVSSGCSHQTCAASGTAGEAGRASCSSRTVPRRRTTAVNWRRPGTAATPRARRAPRASPTPCRAAPGTVAASASPPRRASGRASSCCTAGTRRRGSPRRATHRASGARRGRSSRRERRSTGSGTRHGRTRLGGTRRRPRASGTRTM